MYDNAGRTMRINHPINTGLLVLVCIMISTTLARGQASNEITDVSPDFADAGTTGLLVTFTLDSDAPYPPPAGVLPDSVMIGSLVGASVTHATQTVITAVFDIPADEPAGFKDLVITFSPPEGSLTFSAINGFEVLAAADTPPTVVTHPQAHTAPPGGAVTFTVVASGTAPLEYQWQKNMADISGAIAASFSINPVDWPDAGDYRCIVTNDFGTDYSDAATLTVAELPTGMYPIVDTGQDVCYGNDLAISDPAPGASFYGQDAQIAGNQPSYALSDDGLTIFDNVTGLTWMRDADLDNDGDIDVDDKRTYAIAQTLPAQYNAIAYGGYTDWRVPSIKELYSLIDFRGTDPISDDPTNVIPFIDTDYFEFAFGDTAAGERLIDSQWVTTALYASDANKMFGVNFADGRIKGYDLNMGGNEKTFYVRLCRGNTDYGVNNFNDNGDGTITDLATELMWSQDDFGDGATTGPRSGMIWEDALALVQQKNTEHYLGYNDWRLPNAKEMHSILDYSRAPDLGSAAIDPIFNITQLTNEYGAVDYPWYWTGTTHVREGGNGSAGAYVCFGRGLGYMTGWIDIHGAGCQRSDQKDGDFTGYSYTYDGYYHAGAPQADVVRMFNYVRLVRDAPAPTVCPEDLDGLNGVGMSDLNLVLNRWGDPECADGGSQAPCPEDLDGLNGVGMGDLNAVLNRWGDPECE